MLSALPGAGLEIMFPMVDSLSILRYQTSSVELPARRRLLWPHPSGSDFGNEVVFAAHRGAGNPPQHGDLSHMGERIGDRALEQLLW